MRRALLIISLIAASIIQKNRDYDFKINPFFNPEFGDLYKWYSNKITKIPKREELCLNKTLLRDRNVIKSIN